MIFANYVTYGDEARILEIRPDHRSYMFDLLNQGKLLAAGSFPGNGGGLYLYNVDSQADAERLMADDPYFLGRAVAEYRITPWEIHGANPALLQVAGPP